MSGRLHGHIADIFRVRGRRFILSPLNLLKFLGYLVIPVGFEPTTP